MERSISIRQVIDDIMVHPLLQDLTLERCVNYAVDFMRIVGMPGMFTEKVAKLNVKDYRAMLPCDYYTMIQVRRGDICIRHSTDSYHHSFDGRGSDMTYKIQNDFIYTSFKEGEIEIAYNAIATDCDGYPLIPDNSKLTRALELYIKKQWFTILFDLNQIQLNVLQNVQQEYAWAVGACQSEFAKLSLDRMESLANSWNRLVMNVSEHSRGFVNTGTKERIKIR